MNPIEAGESEEDVEKVQKKWEEAEKSKGESGSGSSDDESPTSERVGKQNGNAPRDNKKQNKQVRDIGKKLDLNKEQLRELHDAISGQGYSYQEILDLAKDMFEK